MPETGIGVGLIVGWTGGKGLGSAGNSGGGEWSAAFWGVAGTGERRQGGEEGDRDEGRERGEGIRWWELGSPPAREM